MSDEVLVILPSPILELEHAPLLPKCYKLRNVSPNSLLFHYFHFKLTFESIKELGARHWGSVTNGQIEIMNLVIQQILRNCVTTHQQDWVDHLELIKFCYNNLEHSTMGATPFQMVMGKSPIMPTTWAAIE